MEYFILFVERTLAVMPGREVESRQNLREICDTFANSEEAKDMGLKVRVETKQADFTTESMSSLSSESVRSQKSVCLPIIKYI